MTLDLSPIVGTAAALLSTISFMPQAIKIIRTRDTESISVGMYSITVLGFILWTAYGAMLSKWPIIGSNGTCLLLSAFILTMKLLPKYEKDKVADTLTPGTDNATSGRRQTKPP
jgi:MtN3 and saliva related transmembrane protein